MHQHAQDRFAAAKRNFMLLASSAVLSLADLASETMELARRQGTILGKEAEEAPS